MPPDPAAITTIICTRDRPEQLLACLASLRVAAADCPDASVEVVVIENGSRSERRLRETDVATVGPPDTRLLRLRHGSLSEARNVGMLQAHGGLLAFVDDDCLVDPAYFRDVLAHWRTQAGDFLIGGRVRLADPADLPFTIKDDPTPQTFHTGIHPGGFIQGCNFILPRATAARIGWFDHRFGAGARFKAGEDTDYLIRAHAAGVPLHYAPDMLVLHRHGRRSFPELDRLNRNYAYANGAILAKHLFRHPWLVRHLLWTLRSTARERLGGPRFDTTVGLTWGSVARSQLRGIAAFLGTVLNPRGRLL